MWFRAKPDGWGWTPASWQGWVVAALYVAAVGSWLGYYFSTREALRLGWHFDLAAAWPVLVASAILIAICWLKGERPSWYRGESD
jgi:hypothetical protein